MKIYKYKYKLFHLSDGSVHEGEQVKMPWKSWKNFHMVHIDIYTMIHSTKENSFYVCRNMSRMLYIDALAQCTMCIEQCHLSHDPSKIPFYATVT